MDLFVDTFVVGFSFGIGFSCAVIGFVAVSLMFQKKGR